jgi:predicted secreted protein
MRRLLLLAALAAAPALASETILELSETGTVAVEPDRMVAVLRAESSGSDIAATQAALNKMVEEGLRQAHASSMIEVSTGSYSVYRANDQKLWTASQGVTLRGTDFSQVLALAAKLEQANWGLVQLAPDLSPAKRTQASQKATELAIAALKQSADNAAHALGGHVVSFLNIQLSDAGRRPVVMRMAAAAAAPSFEPEAQTVAIVANGKATVQVP